MVGLQDSYYNIFPNLAILVEGIWDGDIRIKDIIKNAGEGLTFMELNCAEKLCTDLKPLALPFNDDPAFYIIKKHPNWPNLKQVLEFANDDLELE